MRIKDVTREKERTIIEYWHYDEVRVLVIYPESKWSRGSAWDHLWSNPPRCLSPGNNPWTRKHYFKFDGVNHWGWQTYNKNFLTEEEQACYDVIT